MSVDGTIVSVMAALEGNTERLQQAIRAHADDPSFEEGLRLGISSYCAAEALASFPVTGLKRAYARGTRQHMREVEKFLSSPRSEDELELRGTLVFVLGLLRLYVEMFERQVDGQTASALKRVDRQDLASA